MKILIGKDYDEVSKLASDIFIAEINNNPSLTLGLATGGTPKGLYKNMILEYKNNNVDFSNVKTFNLDEYLGLDKENSQSYYRYMKENLFNEINIKEENINIPNGKALDLDLECDNYDKKLLESGIDIQVLGIGTNAHIAFNEPSDVFKNKTSVVNLAKSTIDDNARFFNSVEEVPTKAISMGIGSIFRAKKIVLLASGKNKAKAIYDTIMGDIDPQVPSSILQLHKDVTLILDEESAYLIKDKINQQ